MIEMPEELPGITGTPVIDGPKVLEWPVDREQEGPSLDEPTANFVNDLHAEIGQCDMVLTTAGNYHMALRDLWDLYLTKFPVDNPLRSWLYTTSPPIAGQQIGSGLVRIGNISAHCRPQVAVGPRALVDSLADAGFTDGDAVPISKTRGNVLLVKKGNPQKVHSIWDLGRRDVRVVTPNPLTEPGSFRLYANSIYGIAKHDPNPRGDMAAADLFQGIFGPAGGREKWLSGRRIHHREVPWSIAFGKGDSTIIFYHLAVYAASTFPHLFEMVPLGGTPADPIPLPGNLAEVLYAVRIKGEWSLKQRKATGILMDLFQSSAFTALLEKHGLDRP
jgi:hypothetical protein